MRIGELKRIAKENDYKLEHKQNRLEHKLEFRRNADRLDNIVNQISIREGIENRIFFDIHYCNEKDLNMIKASIEYAETPLEDREEEKKFYLRHKWIKSETFIDYENFLNYNSRVNYAIISDKDSIGAIKTQFTLKEIEEIKKKFDTDLADFELVEVVDD